MPAKRKKDDEDDEEAGPAVAKTTPQQAAAIPAHLRVRRSVTRHWLGLTLVTTERPRAEASQEPLWQGEQPRNLELCGAGGHPRRQTAREAAAATRTQQV